MTRSQVIEHVKKIILKHTAPERIYLFGSSSTVEFDETSDIDIAYNAPDLSDNETIMEEANKIQTLLKIDIVNIAFTGERFKNRVQSTGKVIYSGSKKLRFEDSLYNFTKAFERLKSAVASKDNIYEEGFSDFYLDIISKRFEFTYEMSWKAIKRCLDFIGITCKNPRECYKEAYSQGIINEEHIWLDMIEQRDLSSHIYDELEISGILNRINDYLTAFEKLIEKLNHKLSCAD